ncbi:hypothetical protein ACHAXR_004839 [Thalassiosira sp. AJA248-18]
MSKPKNKQRSIHSSFYSTPSEHADQEESEADQLALSTKRAARQHDAQTLFTEYKHLFQPTPLFQLVSFLYGKRKIFIIIMFHLVATMVIWSHFFLIKFQELENKVPHGAPYYWSKRIIPPLEFGSMHAILFQMSLLPLTMSRYTISSMSNSKFDRFFPLNKMLRMHIHVRLFYRMSLHIVLNSHCSHHGCIFLSHHFLEIMTTGYLLAAMVIVIGSTAFLRHTSISYETFYSFHAIVAALYLISIIHTFDSAHRDGEKSRSQNVKWFSAPLLYYVCDYAMLYINQRFQTEVKSFIAMKGRGGSRMGLMKLRRPTLFRFKPGQYAFLRAPEVDRFWHPFSIASDPNSKEIEFYLEIYDTGSWTRTLNELIAKSPDENFVMELMGPYGTGLVNKKEYSHVVAIGSGTGIVPILSVSPVNVANIRISRRRTTNNRILNNLQQVFKEHVHQLLHEREIQSMKISRATEARAKTLFHMMLSFIRHLLHMLRCMKKPIDADEEPKAERKQVRVKEALHRLSSHIEQDDTILKTSSPTSTDLNSAIRQISCRPEKETKKAIFSATRSIYSRVLISLLTIYGGLVIGLFLSWTTTSIQLYAGMDVALLAIVVSLQG